MSTYLESLGWMEFLPTFNSRDGWYGRGEIFFEKLISGGGGCLLGTKEYKGFKTVL